jgi:broad specificity phosphatase PhoE
MLLFANLLETLLLFIFSFSFSFSFFFFFFFFLSVSNASSLHPNLMHRFGASYANIIHRQYSSYLVHQARNRLSVERKVLIKSMNASFQTEATTKNNNNNDDNSNSNNVVSKDIWIIRHGQAIHNPRAEYARDVLQCSHDEFLSIMEEDDCFDAPLTDLGQQQAQQIYTQYGRSHWGIITYPFVTAPTVNGEHYGESSSSSSSSKRHNVELIVSSPLSRALQTAELALGDTSNHHHHHHHDMDNINQPDSTITTTTTTTAPITKRVCYEGFREINGWLQNGKRRTKLELEETFPSWDFSLLSSNEDNQWTPTLETTDACMERGYSGLLWMMKERSERSIILVAHGALLKYTLTDHPNVILRDERKQHTSPLKNSHSSNNNKETVAEQPPPPHRCVRKRYHNCELRRYRMELIPPTKHYEEREAATAAAGDNDTPCRAVANMNDNRQQERDVIILTEVDL